MQLKIAKIPKNAIIGRPKYHTEIGLITKIAKQAHDTGLHSSP